MTGPRRSSHPPAAARRVMVIVAFSLVAGAPSGALGANLQDVIDRAVLLGATEVRLPPGRHVTSRPLLVAGASGLTIRAAGTRLVLSNPTVGAVVVRRSTGVRIVGLAIDYEPLA